MSTFYRRRYHGDRGMQALGGLVLVAGTLVFALLLGVAFVDWFAEYDTIATIARGVTR